MKRNALIKTMMTGVLAGSAILAGPLSAQDSNTLNRHLEHQQWQRLQDHQNQSRTIKRGDRAAEQKDATPQGSCSAKALPATDRRRMEAEYMRRAKTDGKASADAWVREQGKRFHRKLVAEGICPNSTPKTRTAGKTDRERDEKGCRMVMKPIAGFGGAPMTMGMVPDCD